MFTLSHTGKTERCFTFDPLHLKATELLQEPFLREADFFVYSLIIYADTSTTDNLIPLLADKL